MKVTMQLSGVDGIANNLSRLTEGMRDRVLKNAMVATMKPIVDAAKAHVTSDIGTLRDAIQSKVSTYGAKGETVFGVIGIRRGIQVPVRIVSRGKHKGLLLVEIPTRYAHMIEFGHVIKVGGKAVGIVPAKPFMRPAWDEEGGDVAVNTFLDVLALGMAEEIDKLNVRNVTRAANGVAPL